MVLESCPETLKGFTFTTSNSEEFSLSVAALEGFKERIKLSRKQQ